MLPFAIVMQTPPETLVELPQPVWKPSGIPPGAVALVMLYIAVKSRPVVGEVVFLPRRAVSTRWRVSILSVGAQTEPAFNSPWIHSRTIVVARRTMVPKRTTERGAKTV